VFDFYHKVLANSFKAHLPALSNPRNQSFPRRSRRNQNFRREMTLIDALEAKGFSFDFTISNRSLTASDQKPKSRPLDLISRFCREPYTPAVSRWVVVHGVETRPYWRYARSSQRPKVSR
jgi:hypothetical protein